MSFTWESPDFDKFDKNLANSREVMWANMNRALRMIGRVIVPVLKNYTPRGATHHLANYTVGEVLGTSDDMRLEIRQAAQSSSGYYYGRAVRGGTRPHFPPPAALVPWVEAILGVHGQRAKGVAFLIARKISRKGTAAQPYHVAALRECDGEIGQIVDEMGVSITATLADMR